jgi:hypothetical protein
MQGGIMAMKNAMKRLRPNPQAMYKRTEIVCKEKSQDQERPEKVSPKTDECTNRAQAKRSSKERSMLRNMRISGTVDLRSVIKDPLEFGQKHCLAPKS